MSVFCYIPFSTMLVCINSDNSTGVAPCCAAVPVVTTDVSFNNIDLVRIREMSIRGEAPHECAQCLNNEKAGLDSQRLASLRNKDYHSKYVSNPTLVNIDFFVGSICNLACVTCGPEASTTWRNELKQDSQVTLVNKNWPFIDTRDTSFIHFTGGEPLLNKEHVKFLKSCTNKKDKRILYNTNGVIGVNDTLRNILQEFNQVTFMLSVDDVNERFEYIRYPAKWERLQENIEHLLTIENANFACLTSVGFLNSDANLEIIKTKIPDHRFIGFDKHLVHGELSIEQFDRDPESVLHYLNNIDDRRGTDWKDTFPEKYDLMIQKLKEQNGKN